MSTDEEDAQVVADNLNELVEALRRSRLAGVPRDEVIESAASSIEPALAPDTTRGELVGLVRYTYRALVVACYELGRYR